MPNANTQWATGKYTIEIHRMLNSTHAPNFMRSAIAPLIRASVMIANIIWKAMKTKSDSPLVTLAAVSPLRPSRSRLPIRPWPCEPITSRSYLPSSAVAARVSPVAI